MSKFKAAIPTYLFILAFLEGLYSLLTYIMDKSFSNWFVFQPLPLLLALWITSSLVNKND